MAQNGQNGHPIAVNGRSDPWGGNDADSIEEHSTWKTPKIEGSLKHPAWLGRDRRGRSCGMNARVAGFGELFDGKEGEKRAYRLEGEFISIVDS